MSVLSKNVDETLTAAILAKTLANARKMVVTHYDFPFELAIELFRRDNYLNQSNVYFYLGLLYNLLKIIENNINIRHNKDKVQEFVQTVDKRLQDKEYSSLFIVLNFFLSPRYTKTHSSCVIKKPESALSQHFANYYHQHP